MRPKDMEKRRRSPGLREALIAAPFLVAAEAAAQESRNIDAPYDPASSAETAPKPASLETDYTEHDPWPSEFASVDDIARVVRFYNQETERGPFPKKCTWRINVKLPEGGPKAVNGNVEIERYLEILLGDYDERTLTTSVPENITVEYDADNARYDLDVSLNLETRSRQEILQFVRMLRTRADISNIDITMPQDMSIGDLRNDINDARIVVRNSPIENYNVAVYFDHPGETAYFNGFASGRDIAPELTLYSNHQIEPGEELVVTIPTRSEQIQTRDRYNIEAWGREYQIPVVIIEAGPDSLYKFENRSARK